MTNGKDMVEVTQVDCDAAADYLESIGERAEALRARHPVKAEGGPLSQAFAHHRLTAQAQGGDVEKMRSEGWSVAVHNDYRLSGEHHTFWLWTHPDGRYVKGEGHSDDEALAQCWEAARPTPLSAPQDVEPVAWLYRDDFEREYTSLTRHEFRLSGKGWTETPLYALATKEDVNDA